MTKREMRSGRGVRPTLSRAPHWRADRTGLVDNARSLKVEARALTRAALGGDATLARRALAVRREALVATMVAGHTPACLEPSGPLPFAPASAPLDHAKIPEVAYDAKLDGYVVTDRVVRRRRGRPGLAGMAPTLRAAGERYAALVEAVASPGGPQPGAVRGGGVSDGGATARCGLAEQLARQAIPAIGDGMVLWPRGQAQSLGHLRGLLTTQALVDRVCLKGWTIDKVLSWRGWSRRQQYRNTCREALEAALGRLAVAI